MVEMVRYSYHQKERPLMPSPGSSREVVMSVLGQFLESTGRSPEVAARTDLVKDVGLSSEDGLDLVLDLCEAFEFDFPPDFNPVVHPSGKRGRRLHELIEAIDNCLEQKETAP